MRFNITTALILFFCFASVTLSQINNGKCGTCVAIYFHTIEERIEFVKQYDTAMVLGTVTSIVSGSSYNTTVYTFRVEESFLSPNNLQIVPHSTIDVRAIDSTDSCHLSFAMGEMWLLGLDSHYKPPQGNPVFNARKCDFLTCRVEPEEPGHNTYQNCSSVLATLRDVPSNAPTPRSVAPTPAPAFCPCPMIAFTNETERIKYASAVDLAMLRGIVQAKRVFNFGVSVIYTVKVEEVFKSPPAISPLTVVAGSEIHVKSSAKCDVDWHEGENWLMGLTGNVSEGILEANSCDVLTCPLGKQPSRWAHNCTARLVADRASISTPAPTPSHNRSQATKANSSTIGVGVSPLILLLVVIAASMLHIVM